VARVVLIVFVTTRCSHHRPPSGRRAGAAGHRCPGYEFVATKWRGLDSPVGLAGQAAMVTCSPSASPACGASARVCALRQRSRSAWLRAGPAWPRSPVEALPDAPATRHRSVPDVERVRSVGRLPCDVTWGGRAGRASDESRGVATCPWGIENGRCDRQALHSTAPCEARGSWWRPRSADALRRTNNRGGP